MSPYRILVVDKDGREVILNSGLHRKKNVPGYKILINERPVKDVVIGQQSLFQNQTTPTQLAHRYINRDTSRIKARYGVARNNRMYDVLDKNGEVLNKEKLYTLQKTLKFAISQYIKENNLEIIEEL